VGRREIIARLKRNPLKRAVRCDKMTLAALAATLRLYRTAPDLSTVLPTLRWLTRPITEMEAVGRAAVPVLRAVLGEEFSVELVDSEAEIGSGALPIEALPSKAISVSHPTRGPQDIARLFREARPPIIGRVQAGRFLLDLRGIFESSVLAPNRTDER
jgi:L-seryl-tRNA(Ser) seleniumtransferase